MAVGFEDVTTTMTLGGKMILWRLGLVSCLIVLIANEGWCASDGEVATFTFLETEGLQTADQLPVNLGQYPFDCLGNVHMCSDGFTVRLKLRVTPGNSQVATHYLVSTGGQSPLSEGWYFRQNYGKDYEIGVAVEDRLWKVSFDLRAGQNVWLALIWTQTELSVYVDGLLASRDSVGLPRVFSFPDIDLFPNIVIGRANTEIWYHNDDKQTPDVVMSQLKHWAKALTVDEAFVETGDSYLLGCSATFPNGESLPGSTSDVSVKATTTGSVRACRQFCTDSGGAVAFLKFETMCACWEDAASVTVESPQDGQCTDTWYVYSCSSLTKDVTYPIELGVKVVKAAEEDVIRPREAVVFRMTTTADEPVTFTLDFDDGVTVVTLSHEVVHEWASAGRFLINVTAGTRLAEQTRYLEILVEEVEDGTAPDLVDVQDNVLNESRQVELFLDAFSVAVMHCSLHYGDGSSKSFPEVSNLFQAKEVYTYETIGFYVVEMDCFNMFGNSSDSHTVLAVHSLVEYENVDRKVNTSIPIRGANSQADSLLVFINGLQTDAVVDDETVTLTPDFFDHSGEHIVTLASQNTQQALYRKVINVQKAFEDISIATNTSACQINDDVKFTFTINGGDFLHLYFNMGDSVEESWYFPQTPDPLPKLYSYSELGTYTVELAVANDVSFKQVTQDFYVERIIESVSVAATQVKDLGEPTVFCLEVDMDKTPAMPVEVEFDYGDGVIEIVALGTKKNRPTALIHTHVFDSYGLYEVYVIVRNHISFVDLFVDVQVGEHIQLVDVDVKDARVLVGEDVEVIVTCPYGAPIELQLDMGDGFTAVLDWPHGGSSVVPSDTLVERTATDTGEEGSGDVDMEKQSRALERKRRSLQVLTTNGTSDHNEKEEVPVEEIAQSFEDLESEEMIPENPGLNDELDEEENIDSEETSQPLKPNDNFVIKYSYTEAGLYTVKVKAINIFSTRESFLCPDVVVVATGQVGLAPDCDLAVGITDSGSLANPIVRKRSEEVVLSVDGVMNCPNDQGFSYNPRYTLSGKQQTEENEWRPELLICESESPEPEFIIPPQSLWYGLYSVSVTMSVSLEATSTGARKKRELGSSPTLLEVQSTNSYLEIVPSDLVAVIDGGDIRDLISTKVVTIDMSASNDPDVKSSNKSGMDFYLFCYTEEHKGIMEQRLLKDHLVASSEIARNAANTSYLYDYGDCFLDYSGIWISGYSLVMPGEVLTMNGSLIFHLVVTKDQRQASFLQTVQVWPTNMSANALTNIDDLLASGNTDGAILVLDMVTSSLGEGSGNDTEDLTETRTLIIDALDKVAKKIINVDQAKKATGVLSTVTSVADQLTDDSKATAAGAAESAADTVTGMADDANLGDLSNIADNVLSAVANVLPKQSKPAVKHSTEDDDSGSGESGEGEEPLFEEDVDVVPTEEAVVEEVKEELVIEVPCCVKFEGLCGWLEPQEDLEYVAKCRPDALNDGCFVLGDGEAAKFKDFVWDEKTCMEEHPDNVLEDVMPHLQCYKDLLKERKFAVAKKTTSSGFSGVDKVSKGLQKKDIDSGGISVGSPQLKLTVAKISQNDTNRRRRVRRETPDIQVGGFVLPKSVLEDSVDDFGVQAVDAADNPFTYSDGPGVTSGVKSLSLMKSSGEAIPVTNTDEPFVIRIPTWSGSPPPEVAVLTDQMIYRQLNLSGVNTTVVIYLKPNRKGDVYTVMFNNASQPNNTHHLWKMEWPDWKRVDEIETSSGFPVELPYTFTIPVSNTTENGTYYLGVQRVERKIYIENPYNFDLSAINRHNVSLKIYSRTCRYWDIKSDQWKTDGCWLDLNQTSQEETVCLCNHLTSFGGDFAVPPNTIDFRTVFSAAKFVESLPVTITVLLVLMLYIAILIWARRMDKKDLLKWGASPLEDSLPTDTYHYQFTVYTGVRKNAGTHSNVSFIMSGDDADSGVRRLSDGKRKTLPTGSIYNYVLSTEYCLGALTYLRIWHDNSGNGKKKGWFLDQVQVTDLQSGEKFFFLCNRWLAVEEDDGMVERIIPVAGNDELKAIKHLFSSSVRRKLTNDHMWVSVFSRPTKSNFTRVQRVSCCVCLLFLTMITNCMFFKADDKAEKVSAVKIGPLSFTLHQLFISVVSTAIVFPPSIIIVSIFRKVRPKRNTVMHENQQLSQKSKKYRWRAINPGSDLWTNEQVSRYQQFKERLQKMFTSQKKSKYSADEYGTRGEKKGKKKKKCLLPHWTIYIAWTLVFFSVVASGFFTILYSMEWGREKSLDWLSTFVLSFFQSVVVVQPIKVLLLAAFISCVMRKPDVDDEEDNFDEAHNDETTDNARPTSARDIELLTNSQRDLQALIEQRKVAASQMAPPDMKALEAAKELRMKELQMEAILKECLIYFFFLIVLFFLSYQARDPASYHFTTNIKNTFVENSPSLDTVTSEPLFWKWTHEVLLPNLYSSKWYNGKEIDWRGSLQIDDRATIRVGVARLRQMRVKTDSCSVQSHFTTLIKHCLDDYNFHDDDTKDYLPGWVRPDTEEMEERAEYCHEKQSPWTYRSSVELKNAPYTGQVAVYKGGGYTFTFKRDVTQTKRLLKLLEQQHWLDQNTRGVFVEFTLYNANANLFGSVIVLVENLATGGAVSKAEVKVFRLSSYVGGFGIIVIIFELTFLVFTLYFLVKLANDLRKQKLKYFKDAWNVLEFIMLSLCITSIIMYGLKKAFGKIAMHVLRESESSDYVNFVTISVWDELFGIVLACAVFFATLKFIKMLKFNKRMSMLGDTILVATKDLKTFSVVFFVYFMAFCMAFYVLFGKLLPSYGSFGGTMESLFAFALGDFDFYEFVDSERILGPIFFFLFVGLIYIGLLGMFLTIIYDSFALVKANNEMRSNDYEIVDFMVGKLKGVFGWS